MAQTNNMKRIIILLSVVTIVACKKKEKDCWYCTQITQTHGNVTISVNPHSKKICGKTEGEMSAYISDQAIKEPIKEGDTLTNISNCTPAEQLD